MQSTNPAASRQYWKISTAVPLRAQVREFPLLTLTIIGLAGVSPRALNLLRVTQLERVITVAAAVAEAEAMP